MLGRTCAALAIVAHLALAISAAETEFSSSTIDLGLVVNDVPKSLKFYTETLGFTEVPGFKVPAAFSKEIGLTDGSEDLDVHVLVLGEGKAATKLKLMGFKKAAKLSDTSAINAETGFRYLTLYVHDSHAAMQRIKKTGAKTLAAAKANPATIADGVFITVLRDPDGNIVELVGPKK